MKLVFALWLFYLTLPQYEAAGNNRATCDQSEIVETGLDSLVVYRQRQSPSWVQYGAWMMLSARNWEWGWSFVRSEAAIQRYSARGLDPSQAGNRVSVAVADTTHGYWYFVTTKDRAGNESCPSPELFH